MECRALPGTFVFFSSYQPKELKAEGHLKTFSPERQKYGNRTFQSKWPGSKNLKLKLKIWT